uniref:Reverse transcriptase domain-containing protein n=1 Tax=Ecklonia arborea TaxID=1849970 RepID=A0A8F0FBX3_9PHAE|nr:hypothetical protein [Ecklonia arborea]
MMITRLIYPICLKAFLPMVAGNGLCRSGDKSRLRGPVNPEKIRQATTTKNRFTKLTREFGLKLGGGRNITGNGPFLIWFLFRMYESPRINIKRNFHIEGKNSQRSKVVHDVVLGTMGNPKRRKSHGFGDLVVGSNCFRRGSGIRQFHSRRSINHYRGASPDFETDIASDRLTNVIHDIATLKNLTLAYESIKSKPGNMTPGSRRETLDGVSLAWVEKAVVDLRSGKYSFAPARRVGIPKAGSDELRSLGVVSPRDKIILTAILQVLEPFYEKKFLESSHGFRPNKGCHTALKYIKYRFGNSNWVIEGDIAKCFDTIDHDILLNILKRSIKCYKTIALIKRSLRNPLEDQGMIIKPKKGTLQGSPLSPLLCNIYLHEMDLFIEGLERSFNSGSRRRKSLTYRKVQYELSKQNISPTESKYLKVKLGSLSSKDHLDPDFRRLVYTRYADDFVIGISGPKTDCERIREEVKEFLMKNLALRLSMKKTVISHFNRIGISFLGTSIRGNQEKEKVVRKLSKGGRVIQARTTSRARMEAPIAVLLDRGVANGLFRRRQCGEVVPTAVRQVVNLDHSDIVKFYNQKIRGILNYYSFTDNAKSLGTIVHGMKHSCTLTLALKFKLRVRAKVFAKFGKYLECKETGTKLFIPNSFSSNGKFYINPTAPEIIMDARWNNKLSRSNLIKGCLVCGETPSEMHHVRKLKDMKIRYQEGSIDFWTLQMAAINRKQIPLCKAHHLALHNGSLTPFEKEKLKEAISKFKDPN